MRQNGQSMLAFCVVLLISAACSPAIPPVVPATPTAPQILASPTPAVPTTAVPASPTASATAFPTPTATQARPTATPTPAATAPGAWQVPVVSLPGWNGESTWRIEWKEAELLEVEDYHQAITQIDATTGHIITVTPTPGPADETVSASAEYQIVCSPTGLKLVRWFDQRLLAEAPLHIQSCEWSVQWAFDGSAAAIVDEKGEVYV